LTAKGLPIPFATYHSPAAFCESLVTFWIEQKTETVHLGLCFPLTAWNSLQFQFNPGAFLLWLDFQGFIGWQGAGLCP
jgi:hypothetical protein